MEDCYGCFYFKDITSDCTVEHWSRVANGHDDLKKECPCRVCIVKVMCRADCEIFLEDIGLKDRRV